MGNAPSVMQRLMSGATVALDRQCINSMTGEDYDWVMHMFGRDVVQAADSGFTQFIRLAPAAIQQLKQRPYR